MTATQQDQEPRSHRMKSSGQGRGRGVSLGETMALGRGGLKRNLTGNFIFSFVFFIFTFPTKTHVIFLGGNKLTKACITFLKDTYVNI